MFKQPLSWKRAVIGFVLGLILLPGLVASVSVYLPYIFGYDVVFGPGAGSVISEGYVLSADDVQAIGSLAEVLDIMAFYGLIAALACGLIGLFSKSKKDPL